VDLIYIASGSSIDHVYGFYGTPLAFVYELKGGNSDENRFFLPAEEIVPNAQEILDSIVGLIRKAKELGYFQMN